MVTPRSNSSLRGLVPFLLGCCLPAGCATEEEEPLTVGAYAAQAAELACALYEECGLIEYYGDSYEACVQQVRGATLSWMENSNCEFDSLAAEQCLEEWESATCEGSTTGGFDSACQRVCIPTGTTGNSTTG